jgi:aspartate carbamoyltransferase catalytic subunit
MNLLSIRDLETDDLIALSEPLVRTPAPVRKEAPRSSGTLAFLFEQPSLRTMSSFAAAATRVGLAPISITTSGNSFRDQTEFEDEIQQLSLTSQCVVVRSSETLNPSACQFCPVPIINAGDGNNEHPTQTLIDIAVMRQFGLTDSTVAIMGNLRDHRTSHSLVLALQRLQVKTRLISPAELVMDPSYTRGAAEVCVAESFRARDEALRDVDFVYVLPTMSLTSPARIFEEIYSWDLAQATQALKPTAKILHPFPRFGELDKSIDYSTFDAYHLQTSMAPAVREKVLRRLLHAEPAGRSAADEVRHLDGRVAHNREARVN